MKWKFALWLLAALWARAEKFDVVVYGGTAGGVMAAIAASEEGMATVLLEPGRHAGGMVTGGLERMDMDRRQHVTAGQRAGVAAALVVRGATPVHHANLVELLDRLRKRGQILSLGR